MKPDLNLLVVFEAVARFGSVSAAAHHLSLSQPAVSHALNRLRKTIGDPLFTRSGRGLIATPRGAEMIPAVRALVLAARELTGPALFDPGHTAQVFRIAATDYAANTLVPALVHFLRKAAPGVRLDLLPASGTVINDLAQGRVDLSFWGTTPPAGPIHHTLMFREHYLGVACANHPMFRHGPAVGLADYVAYPHAVISLQAPGANAIDQALQALGLARRIALSSHSFAGNLAALPGSDLICSLPARLCQSLGPHLRRFDLPLQVSSYDYGIIWHDRTHHSAPHRWLRDAIGAAVARSQHQDAPLRTAPPAPMLAMSEAT